MLRAEVPEAGTGTPGSWHHTGIRERERPLAHSGLPPLWGSSVSLLLLPPSTAQRPVS